MGKLSIAPNNWVKPCLCHFTLDITWVVSEVTLEIWGERSSLQLSMGKWEKEGARAGMDCKDMDCRYRLLRLDPTVACNSRSLHCYQKILVSPVAHHIFCLVKEA